MPESDPQRGNSHLHEEKTKTQTTEENHSLNSSSTIDHSQEIVNGKEYFKSLFSEGQKIGRKYKIVELLGCGGMGQVYLVEHLLFMSKDKEFYALKVLRPGLYNEKFRQRFIKEVKIVQKIVHENIIQIRDFGDFKGHLYFTMDFSTGVSLDKIVKDIGPLSQERALDIIQQVLEALRIVHKKQIIHRDLKPSNIMVESRDNSEHVLLIDFGIAKSLIDQDITLPQNYSGQFAICLLSKLNRNHWIFVVIYTL